MSQLEMFGLNIKLLIGLIVFLIIGFVLLIALWIGVKMWLSHRGQKRHADKEARSKLDVDGQPLPPMGEGLCQACGQAFRRVYHLSSGRRLCPECYRARRPLDQSRRTLGHDDGE